MSDQKVWLGPRGYMQWVPAPRVDMPSTRRKFRTEMAFLGGGARTRQSNSGHVQYVMSWSMKTRDEIRPIIDMSTGMWGDGHIYFSDPFAMDKNVLNDVFSTPYLSGKDGIIIDNRDIRPQLIPTDANPYGFPAYQAVFDVPAYTLADRVHQFYVPIPPGYTAWVGAHGLDGTGGVVECINSIGPDAVGASVDLALLPVTGATRFNHSVDSSTANGIILRLSGPGTITLAGIMVQVLPTGTPPQGSMFISGQGASGLRFADMEYNPYNAALDLASLTVTLNEDEPWSFVPNLTGA